METGKFKYLGIDGVKIYEYNYSYDEDWLKKSSYDAPFEMARCSLCMSMAASRAEFITEIMDQLGYSYVNKVNEVEEGINVLAGDKVTDSVYYPAQFIDGKPYINSIGYAIGKKEVGDSTVILVAIRGGDYGIEWGGNFNIGTGETHEGFLMGCNQVLDGLKQFIESQEITGRIKTWVLGYSRASSVANLLAAKLDDGIIEGIKPEDVYAFCFEVPRVTKDKNTQDKKYSNIHNFANPDDIVPKTPMGIWGYMRYGKTFFYPSHESDINYPEQNKKMRAEMPKILGYELFPAVNSEHIEEVFIENLGFSAENQEVYVKTFQTPLEMISAATLGGGGKEIPITPEDEATLKLLGRRIELLNPANTKGMLALLDVKDGNLTHINPNCPLLEAHSMELSLCWLESFKGFEDFGADTLRLVYINGAADLDITDKEGKLVASLKEGKPVPVEGGLFAQINIDGEFMAAMPINMTYDVKINASLQNLVSFTVQNYNMNLGQTDALVGYGALALPHTSEIEAHIPEGVELNPSLMRKGRSVRAKYKCESGEVDIVKITPQVEGMGQVIGGGYFTRGRYAGLTARPAEGYVFDGWFEGARHISRSPFFQLAVGLRNETITARFNKAEK